MIMIVIYLLNELKGFIDIATAKNDNTMFWETTKKRKSMIVFTMLQLKVTMESWLKIQMTIM